MKVAVYPGSFDPFTKGHYEVLATAAGLFDKVIAAVLVNPDKAPLFTVSERMEQIVASAVGLHNVEVDQFQGLLAHYVVKKDANVIVRGLRAVSDYENETRLAHMNRTLEPRAVTIFLPTRPEVSFISSSLVKQVAAYGGDASPFVPDVVATALREKYSQRS